MWTLCHLWNAMVVFIVEPGLLSVIPNAHGTGTAFICCFWRYHYIGPDSVYCLYPFYNVWAPWNLEPPTWPCDLNAIHVALLMHGTGSGQSVDYPVSHRSLPSTVTQMEKLEQSSLFCCLAKMERVEIGMLFSFFVCWRYIFAILANDAYVYSMRFSNFKSNLETFYTCSMMNKYVSFRFEKWLGNQISYTDWPAKPFTYLATEPIKWSI